jgi:hypothetical protein
MEENNLTTEVQEEPIEEILKPQKQKKELSEKQIQHLNNIRIKALEKKREIKLKKNEEHKNKVSKPQVIEEEIKTSTQCKSSPCSALCGTQI